MRPRTMSQKRDHLAQALAVMAILASNDAEYFFGRGTPAGKRGALKRLQDARRALIEAAAPAVYVQILDTEIRNYNGGGA